MARSERSICAASAAGSAAPDGSARPLAGAAAALVDGGLGDGGLGDGGLGARLSSSCSPNRLGAQLAPAASASTSRASSSSDANRLAKLGSTLPGSAAQRA